MDSSPRAQVAGGPTGPASWIRKDRKPIYIDFESWHLVKIFERMVRDVSAGLMAEEVLPDTPNLPQVTASDRRVVELIVEVPLGGSSYGTGV